MFLRRKPRKPGAPSLNDTMIAAIGDTYLVARFDMDRRFLYVNPVFTAVTGLTPEDVVGQSQDIVIRPKDRDSAEYRELWDTLRAGRSVTRIVPRLNKQGEERWYDVTYNPLPGPDGKPVEVLLLSHDITAMHLRRRDNRSQVDAIGRSMAVIEFDLEGTILNANQHFLDATGYRLAEIVGRKHAIFMPEGETDTEAYRQFWQRLASGASENGQVKRIGKSGDVIWLEATYETLIDPEGRPFKVVKYAFDVTNARNREVEVTAKLDAIQKVQAVIEFDAQGRILTANDIFCKVMGYASDEIIGKHHSMFVDPAYRDSPDYAAFWTRLRAGEVMSDQFRRIGKGGREVYIEASYNPVRNAAGEVVKVVKFAVDTTPFRVTLAETGAALSLLADGDLRTRIDRDLGNLDEIRIKFNAAVAHVDAVMAKVIRQSVELVGDADAIRSASEELSSRTEHQAATLEQSAAALEELSTAVRNTTEQSRDARGKAHQAKDDTSRSSEVIRNAMQAMEQIADSSKKISSITGVIDEIAFQTNLLALNAGIEAARAGDAGRGFAVVASEVRALAQRSSDAARQIAELIGDSTRQVEQGVKLVGEAEGAMGKIDGGVSEILELIRTIAAAAEEQSIGLTEMNKAIADLDRVTQQNAAMAEESSDAIRRLGDKATDMQTEAGYFVTSPPEGHAPPVRDSRPMPRAG